MAPGEFDAIEALLELRGFHNTSGAPLTKHWQAKSGAGVDVSRETPGVMVYPASGGAWAVSMLHPALPQVIKLLDRAKEDEDADD